MNGWNIADWACFWILALVLFLSSLAGCRSTRVGDDYGIVAGNSQSVGRLEATVASLDRTVADSRERIAGIVAASRDITDGIVRLEFLFGEYEREVVRILGEIDGIRGEIEEPREGDSGLVGDGFPDGGGGRPCRVPQD